MKNEEWETGSGEREIEELQQSRELEKKIFVGHQGRIQGEGAGGAHPPPLG